MNYRSLAQLNRDLSQWRDHLPRVDVIVGVPRSGMLAANLLALQMQLPLADVEGLLASRTMGAGRRLGPAADALAQPSTVLVIDDSVDSGESLAQVRERIDSAKIPHRVHYGAVYVSPQARDLVDYYYEVVPQPRVFDWNVLHHRDILARSCMDIDGVLCRDPTETENDDGAEYVQFLRNVQARYVPSVKVGHLVTCRLERYRADTVAWLRVSGVSFGELIMHPAESAVERRQLGNYAAFKAAAYRRSGAWLFLESSEEQAREIARLARRPVYCTDTLSMVLPSEVAPGMLSSAGEGLWQARIRLQHSVQAFVQRSRLLARARRLWR